MKRKQIQLKMYHLDNLHIENGKFVITESGREISHFRNYFINAIEKVLKSKIIQDAYFILRFNEFDPEEDTAQSAKYKSILESGIWLNGVHYVKSIKSPSMLRSQKTIFIREDIADKVFEHVSLGKIPSLTVISKYEAGLGISLSSTLMVDAVPRIVFIEDFKKTIIEDVEVIRDCDVDHEQVENMKQQLEREKEVDKSWSLKRPTEDELGKLDKIQISKEYQSKSGLYREDRILKIEEIDKPKGYNVLEDGKVYPIFHIDQSEKLKFPKLSSDTIGKQLVYLKNHSIPLTCFDGQALGSFEWFEKVSEQLELGYTTNALQGRLPYFKGLIIRFDIKKWCEDHGISEINGQNIEDIDVIATESCWKVFHDYSEGKKKSLFTSVDDWYKLMSKYGAKRFGVANHAKLEKNYSEYTPLGYQFIYALPILTFEDLKQLSKPFQKMIRKVKEGKDVAYIKAFLRMLNDDENEEYFADKCLDMINIDERMIFDRKIRGFLNSQINNKLEDLCQGRIPVRGGYRYISQDPIAFMEWAAYGDCDKVNGFIEGSYNVYKAGTNGEHLLMRNPTTSHKEIVKTHFCTSDNEYVQHLDNVIIAGIHDLLLPKFTADVDGDICLYTKDPILTSAMIDSVPLIHEGDKSFSEGNKVDYQEYNKENSIKFELQNTSSMIGTLTNWNTKIADMVLSKHGSIDKADLVISCNKIYQMMLIDAVKTGETVQISEAIRMWGKKLKKPYFMRHVYGGDVNKYNKEGSFFNRYVHYIEMEMKKINNITSEFEEGYLQDLNSPKEIIMSMFELPYNDYLNEVMDKLKPVYAEYADERKAVSKEKQEILKQPKYKRDSDELDLINAKYTEIAKRYRWECHMIEPNLSILASAAVELGYIEKNNPSFAWDVAFDGMRYNALLNRPKERTEIHDLGKIKTDYPITGIASVQNGQIEICRVELDYNRDMMLDEAIIIEAKLPDGKYPVLSIMDQHFAVSIEDNLHDEYLCMISYPKQIIENIRTISNEKVGIVCRREHEKIVVPSKANQDESISALRRVLDYVSGRVFKIIANPDKRYINVHDDDGYFCSISKEDITAGKVSLDMDGMDIKFEKVIMPNNDKVSSFMAYINVY